MQRCVSCGAEVARGDGFCESCGATVPPPPAAGRSSLALDAETVNTLLEAYVNRPGGPAVCMQDGRIVVRVGPLAMAVDRVELGASGIDVQLSVLP
jgi:hypothetical protein